MDEKISCVVCNAYLFEEDDVVHCPVCGAPHHRECYNKIGKCAMEEYHGTENEYRKPENESEIIKETESETVTCSICKEKFPKDEPKCPKCSAPQFSKIGSFQFFDFLGGIPKDFKIEEDITANEAKKFVIANTHRYIPKFASLNKSNKGSWNWLAFLFPACWFLSRKMYKSGIILGLLTIISSFFSYPLSNILVTSMPSGTYAESVQWMMSQMPQIDSNVLIFAVLGSLLLLTIRIICGVFGDWFYRQHVVKTIREIKSNSEDIDFDYRKKGGVNTLLFMLSFMALEYLPSIIMSLL